MPPFTLLRRTRIAVTAVVAAGSLLFAAPSFGHSLTLANARTVAAKQAQRIKTETRAKSTSVIGCSRKSVHKVACKIRSRYSGAIRSCVTNVLVYYTSHADRRPGAKIGRTLCS